MEEQYQLCQIYIPNAANILPGRAFYSCGLNGRYKARVVGITHADQTNAKDNRLIRISSDSFRSTAGTYSQSILYCNRHEHNMGNPQGTFPLEIEFVGNSIDLTVTASTAYTGGANDSFNFAILTLEVCPVNTR